MVELKINPLFRDKIPPLSSNEYERLEQNILKDGKVREPIIAWKGTIIDGHNRYSICQKHPEIQFAVEEKDFADEYEAIAWMCSNQLGRRNITAEQKAKLIQEEYDARMKTVGGQIGHPNYYEKDEVAKSSTLTSGVQGHKIKTRTQMAKEHRTTDGEIKTAVEWGRGVDAAEEVSPGFTNKILSGEIKATKKAVSDLRKAEPEERKKMVEEILEPKPKTEKQVMRNLDKTIDSIHKFTESRDVDPEHIKNQLDYAEGTLVESIKSLVRIYKDVVTKEMILIIVEGLERDVKEIIKEFNLK